MGFLCIILCTACCTTQDIRDFRKAEQDVIKLRREVKELKLVIDADQRDLRELERLKEAVRVKRNLPYPGDSLPNELIFR